MIYVHVCLLQSTVPLWALKQNHAGAQGDWKDWFWMVLSTVVLVYFSACLFMLYDFLYRAAGFVTVAEFMSR
jgi:hypothetical protein